MAKILIDGIVGLDVTIEDIRKQLEGANGKDVVAEIASPGGMVSEGLKIFNALKNYSGNVDTHLTGMVASMGTYIAMVGTKRTAEKNAVFMIHNGSTFAFGDHRTMRKTAIVLESMSNLVAKEYSIKSDTALPEIRKAMDEETFYFGDEIKEAGFVHEMVGDDDPEMKEENLIFAQLMVDECNAKINTPDLVKKDMKALSTMMLDIEPKNKKIKKDVHKSVKPDNQKQEVKTMTLAEMKAKFPELYNQICDGAKAEGVSEGLTSGVDQERVRVKALTEMRAKFPKEHSQKVIDEAILEGHDLPTLTLNLMAADEAAKEVQKAIDDKAKPPGGDSDDVPAMVDGEMTHPDHLDSVSKDVSAMPGIM